MVLGLVSNCWQTQLASGVPLDDLLDQAAQQGYRAIELRQGFFGEYESRETHIPDAALLTRLPEEFPQLRFNVAIQFPFLGEGASDADSLFQAGKWAADAVAGSFPPHLRLVDLTTAVTANGTTPIEPVAASLAQLARALSEIDGILSIENARQPWPWFRAVFDAARHLLDFDAPRLKLCYDPVNLLLSGNNIDTLAVTQSLSADEISMVHFKQRVDGRIATAVCDGDIDWRAQLNALTSMGYAGPFLFEVASHTKLWEYLSGSREYLRRRGLHIEGTS